MLTFAFPFVKADAAKRRNAVENSVSPGLPDAIAKARASLAQGDAHRALLTIAPLMMSDAPAPEACIIVGRALSAMGRYPEALEQLDACLARCPDSVEGLILAGLTAARARELARAVDFFNRAAESLPDRPGSILKTLGPGNRPDPVALEDMVAEAEAHPEDRDLALALGCVLGRAGHFRAVERFMWVFDGETARVGSQVDS